MATTGGSVFEVKQNLSPASTILRSFTSKHGNLSSYFEDKTKDNFENTTLKEILSYDQSIQANKARVFDQLSLKHICRFCNTF